MKLPFSLLPGLGFVIYLLAMAIGTVQADGIFLSERNLKPLEIPGQTAILLHSQGKETLTIWNTVQADSAGMAWVLPLPSVPEVIQQTDPAAVRLVQMVAAPRMIIYKGFGRFGWVGWSFAAFVLVISVALLMAPRPDHPASHAFSIIVCLVIVAIFAAGSFACYGTAGPQDQLMKPDGISIKAEQDTGNYETTVISGDSADQVNAWLTANGFSSFSGDQLKTVETYLARKWMFLCARLKARAPGLTGVRPLTLRFASQHAVYPMSLTQGAGTVPVDLYTVGRDSMEDPTGRLRQVGRSEHSHRISLGYLGEALSAAAWELRSRDVLLEGLIQQADGRISHLRGVFGPASDWSDVVLASTMNDAPGIRYRTRKAWMLETLESVVGGMAIFSFLVVSLFTMSIGPARKRPGWQWSVAACVVALGVWSMGLYRNSANTVFIAESQLDNAAPGSPESFQGLLDTWVQSLSSPP